MGNGLNPYYGFEFIERIELFLLPKQQEKGDAEPKFLQVQFNQDADRGRDFAELARSCVPRFRDMFRRTGVAKEAIPKKYFIDEVGRTLTFFHADTDEGFSRTHYEILECLVLQLQVLYTHIGFRKNIVPDSEEYPQYNPTNYLRL